MSESNKKMKLTCPISYCQWRYYSDFSIDRSFQIIKTHVETEHSWQTPSSLDSVKPQKLIPPGIDIGIGEKGWNTFLQCWKSFCRDSCSSQKMQSLQLIQCTSKRLHQILLQSNPNIRDCQPEIILRTLKELALSHTFTEHKQTAKKAFCNENKCAFTSIPCPRCNRLFNVFNGKNIKPFKLCLKCFKDSKKKPGNRCPYTHTRNHQMSERKMMMDASEQRGVCNSQHVNGLVSESVLKVRNLPKLSFRVRPIGKSKTATVVGVADTGAQSNIWSLSGYLKAGFLQQDLEEVSLRLYAANQERIDVVT